MLTPEELKAKVTSFKPEGIDDAKWGKVVDDIINLHNTEVSGLKNNELALKQEKTEITEKYRAEKDAWTKERAEFATKKTEWDKTFDDSKKEYEKKIADMDKKLADNQPEQIKKLYEERQAEMKATYEQQQKNLNDQLALLKTDYENKAKAKDEQLAKLEQGVFQRDCLEQFNTAVKDKNIDPAMLDVTRSLILGDDYNKFAKRDIGNGKYLITRNDGKDIGAAVSEFLSSDAGKRFILNGSTGGGADGGNKNAVKQTMTRQEFEALPYDQRSAVIKKVSDNQLEIV